MPDQLTAGGAPVYRDSAGHLFDASEGYGVVPADRLIFAPITPCDAGCEAINVYPGTNQVTVAYSTPALGVGAVVNIPIAVYRITT